MSNVPLRGISISDFRRLDGHRTLPLDAPVVLLHGPNGAGKTSVLSALELALTGEIRSMRRHDERYTAHLPTHGHSFATVRAEVANELTIGEPQSNMTVGGDRIEGQPALGPEAAQFYSERCYLDQVSLGQLLELYQYREGKEESALARFVNELLGLDQLDALRGGLSDATDVRRLRKLSDGFADTEANAERAARDLREVTLESESANAGLEHARRDLQQSLTALGHAPPESDSPDLEAAAERILQASQLPEERSRALQLDRQLSALGGRIDVLGSRPSTIRLEEAKARAADTAVAMEQWRAEYEAPITEWREAVVALQLDGLDDPGSSLSDELERLDSRLARHHAVVADIGGIEERIAGHEAALAGLQTEIAQAEQLAGTLAAALAALREHVSDNVCPVCDRDFGELGDGHLAGHLDRKIAELTDLGRRIQVLTQQRDSVTAEMEADQRALAGIRAQLLSADQLSAAAERREAVQVLQARLEELRQGISDGDGHRARSRDAQNELADLQAVAEEEQTVLSELESAAKALGLSGPAEQESLGDAWRRLADVASARTSEFEARSTTLTQASESLAALRSRAQHADELQAGVAAAAKAKLTWDERLAEAKRRQAVAREVHTAANNARSAIVQQVFTESLNEVWRSVFTRLAPAEPFVPAFGIPTSSKTALELHLETVHSSGEAGGSPQMMLSAGNLNTAALSLFIALHLAVEPVVPCLVFDDPVQSMDEVHVAQFAGLIRVLSKNHGRQVIVAVHERELFEYLALELSPAYDGDALITIELGERSNDEDRGVTRLSWSPDPALAV
ncbi:MAG: AAA family ATPase [Acidimicrobiia bacterium]|nr:AAA family ATPase [Acidimicrobiia bacterium]